jgi:hypothetical protein
MYWDVEESIRALFSSTVPCLLKETEEIQKSLTGLPVVIQTAVSDKNMGHVCWYVVGYTKPSKLSNVKVVYMTNKMLQIHNILLL